MKKTAEKPNWKILCFRLIGRSRRMDRWKKMLHTPRCVIQQEKELIQEAYDEMRDACLADELYQDSWERNRAGERRIARLTKRMGKKSKEQTI